MTKDKTCFDRPLTRVQRINDLIIAIPKILNVKGIVVGNDWPWDELIFNLAQEIVSEEFKGKPRDKLTQKQMDIAVAFWVRVFEVADPEKREA